MLLEIKNLYKSYDNKVVLNDINLKLILSDIKDKNGNSLYKEVLEKAKEVYKNELCNI